jgi:hypothetical protein
MAVLPDLDALALRPFFMFEKADAVSAALRPPLARRTDDAARMRRAGGARAGERSESRSARRAGDALRAVEWSEITARLNAARDLRLLLRSESQGRIEAVAASFGDAAASYFAMIDDNEPAVNLDPLDCSKASDGMESARVAVRHDRVSGGDTGPMTDATGGDARDRK